MKKPNWFARVYGSLGEAFGLMERTQEGAFKATTPSAGVLQLALFASTIVLVLGLCVATLGGIRDKDGLVYAALVLASVALLLIVVAMYFVRPGALAHVSSNPADTTDGKKATTAVARWSRPAIRLPDDATQLSEQLRAIRQQAQKLYRELLTNRNGGDESVEVDENHVRLNIFIPDLNQIGKNGQVCELHIPEGFSHGMPSDQERQIRFNPGQGLAGYVYTTSYHYGSVQENRKKPWRQVFLDGEPSVGEDVFQLTVKQNKVIAPNLRWIISFPLCVTDAAHSVAVGVLNLDGVETMLSEQEMGKLFSTLRPQFQAFAALLEKYICCRIAISLHEV